MKKVMLFVITVALFAPAVSAEKAYLGAAAPADSIEAAISDVLTKKLYKKAQEAEQAKRLTASEQRARVAEKLQTLIKQYPAQAKLISNLMDADNYLDEAVRNESGMSYDHKWQNILGALEGLYERFTALKSANAEAAKKTEDLLRVNVYGQEGHPLYWLADEVNILWPRYNGKPQCAGTDWFDSLR